MRIYDLLTAQTDEDHLMVSWRSFNSMKSAGVMMSMVPEFNRSQAASEAKNVVLMHGLYSDGLMLDPSRAASARSRPERHGSAEAAPSG